MNQFLRLLVVFTIAMSLVACGGGDDVDPFEASPGSDDAANSASTPTRGTPSDGGPSTPSSDITGKMLDEMESLTAVLKDVKDEASAKAAAAYITGYAERHEKLAEQFKSLTPAQQVASAQKHVQRNMSVQMGMHEEMMRIKLDPELNAHLNAAFEELK